MSKRQTRMITTRIFFARLNENRNGVWASDSELLKGGEEYFRSNGFGKLEYNKNMGHDFASPVVGYREEDRQRIATIFNSQIDRYDMKLLGLLESLLYKIIDNEGSYGDEDASTGLMLVTDSLSYNPITKIDEISVSFQNLMDEGLCVLFANNKAGYAMFDSYAKLFQPIPVEYQ